MTSSTSSIQLHPSTKPYYSEHNDLIRFRLEFDSLSSDPLKSSFPSLSSIFYDQLSSIDYSNNTNEFSSIIISFGYIYLLKYPEQNLPKNSCPKTIDSLLNNHFLPPLFDTFFPSTILERIEITNDNSQILQQIFYQSNHTIKREVPNSFLFY